MLLVLNKRLWTKNKPQILEKNAAIIQFIVPLREGYPSSLGSGFNVFFVGCGHE